MGLLRRTVAVLGALLAVTTAFVVGLALSPGHHVRGPRLALTGQDLGMGLSCQRLRQWYVDHALDQVTAWGWQGPPIYAAEGGPTGPGAGVAGSGVAEPPTRSASGASPDSATTSATGTNVQEAGVDEPDVVKTAHGLLVRVTGDRLLTYDVSGRRPVALGSARLVRTGNPQLLLSGDRAVVLGSVTEDPAAGVPLVTPPPRTWVRTFDLSDHAQPREVDARQYDGALVTARQTGDVVRLVLSSGPPALDFVRPSATTDQSAALAHNRAVARDSSIGDWLPAVTDASGSATPLVDCAHVAVPDSFGGLGTMSVVGFTAAEPDAPSATAVATGSDVAYASPDHLYVATSPSPGVTACCTAPAPGPTSEVTHLYAFDLLGTAARYAGAGAVDGTVAGSAAMDEQRGVLRVAVGPADSRTSSSVVLLRPESGRLAEVGRLDGLGPGEQLKAVRWFGDVAVVVTFRQVDPFDVVDLADPAHPRLEGALHVPGWSSYLHPVGGQMVLGLGQAGPQPIPVDGPPVPRPTSPSPVRPPPPPPTPVPPWPTVPRVTMVPDPDTPTVSPGDEPTDPPVGGGVGAIRIGVERAKATLYDVADPSRPRALGTVRYPAGSLARAGLEPHQVTWLPGSRTLLTVVSRGYGAPGTWVSVLKVRGGALRDRLVPVPATTDANGVRTVPLADGRVVLVAGDVVRFLPL
jgi:hypothetical protein